MSKIENIGERIYSLGDMKISLMLPGHVYLYGEGDPQLFAIPANTGLKDLPALFRTDELIQHRAQTYKEGITSRRKFTEQIENLVKQKEITVGAKEKLKLFIDNFSNLPPETIRRQLIIRGFSHISDKIDCYETDPRLTATCSAFKEFLKHIPAYLKEEVHEFTK